MTDTLKNTPQTLLNHTAQGLAACHRPLAVTAKNPEALDALASELEREMNAGGNTDAMLYTQARALDALFKRIIAHDMLGTYQDPDRLPYLRDDQLNLALRAQKQCRATIEAFVTLTKKDPEPS